MSANFCKTFPTAQSLFGPVAVPVEYFSTIEYAPRGRRNFRCSLMFESIRYMKWQHVIRGTYADTKKMWQRFCLRVT
jgi:hypothetical protein